MSAPLVEAVGLTRHYQLGKRVLRALDGVDITIARGETLGLVGESGSGKSTLGRTLVGLQSPTQGSLRFDGVDTAGITGAALRQLHRRRQLVFQDPSGALNPRMTIGATLTEHLRVQGWTRAAARVRVPEVLTQAGLSPAHAARYPHEISGGQRQRAVIARAISTDPDFLVADEPVSALDVSTRAQIINLLRSLQRARGLGMLFISHDLSVVAHTCRRVAVMYLGRVVELAPREALFANPLHPYTKALLSAVPLPDPLRERARSRIILRGETPDPSAPPSGCRFHPRCPLATEICVRVDPPMRPLGPDQTAACHHAGERVTSSAADMLPGGVQIA
ncbi:MAG: ATP-binding cassette domain-containing protein [Rhodospirillales bacterium]|nr:ATP-binding cassette domain-containing protein [Rhodospirillales bacterium]